MTIKKKYIVLMFVIVFVLFNGGRLFMANPEKNELKKATTSYLSEKGYDTEKDIADIYVVNMGQDEVIYSSVVTFTDEPKVEYFYSYHKNTKELKQISYVNKGTKQALKHQES
ncbi:DUF3139 domain-containing protein [Thalassobacillus sp. CUG 92003]|uniref:DUF3139 domain-containing protein n=1 Tax=Thalassobacillus sp. CUG 92003 TaxID=2736641 RepID=UPI0015E77F81|nr:DUF3139 domain-containing protein [Thalassobacillus sp. CUG 92003]